MKMLFGGWLIAAATVTAGDAGQHGATAAGPTAILDVTRLSGYEVAGGRRVRVRGVVTWRWHSWHAHCIVQDETAGIWINIASAREQSICEDSRDDLEAIVIGDEVEIDGVVERGGYAPNVLPITIRKIGRRPLPEPITIDDERFFSGSDNLRRVIVEGVVQGVREDNEYWLLRMERASRLFVASILRSSVADPATTLVDARVRLTGIVGVHYNTRGQTLHPSMLLLNATDVEILEPPPESVFDIPFTPLESLDHFSPVPSSGHRIRTGGVVSYALPGECFYLQEESTGVRVAVRSPKMPKPGDRVEVAGFLDRSRDFAGLAEAVHRVVGRATAPDPRRLSPAQVIEISNRARTTGQMAKPGDFDGCLIRFTARLVDARQTADGGTLQLDADGESIFARLAREEMRRLPALDAGCVVDVTGILQIDLGGRFRASPVGATVDSHSVIDRLALLVPAAADVVVIKPAPWWNARRLAVAAGALACVLLAAVAWAALLRRRVAIETARATQEIRRRHDAEIEFEASIRERNRLAANLHDTLLQTLGGAGFQLDTCRRAVAREDLADTSTHLDVARRMLKHAAGELRGSVWALRTTPLAGKSFTESLSGIVGHLRQGQPARIDLDVTGEPFELPDFVAGNLLLVAQEAIRNALHHAQPSAVRVAVACDDVSRSMTLMVGDDGRGFDTAAAAGPAQGHFGIQGMRERIGSLGGLVAIESEPGRGTTVRVHLSGIDAES